MRFVMMVVGSLILTSVGNCAPAGEKFEWSAPEFSDNEEKEMDEFCRMIGMMRSFLVSEGVYCPTIEELCEMGRKELAEKGLSLPEDEINKLMMKMKEYEKLYNESKGIHKTQINL